MQFLAFADRLWLQPCPICCCRIAYLLLVITCGVMFTFKTMNTDVFYWFDTVQISPMPTVVNPCSLPAGQVWGPGEGKLAFSVKQNPWFVPTSVPKHSNSSDRNVQECLIWLQPVWRGGGGGRRGERRLACHCIIPAAINSLCPEAEWTHHSNGPQAEWHQAALNQSSAPPHHTSRFKQAEKAAGV